MGEAKKRSLRLNFDREIKAATETLTNITLQINQCYRLPFDLVQPNVVSGEMLVESLCSSPQFNFTSKVSYRKLPPHLGDTRLLLNCMK